MQRRDRLIANRRIVAAPTEVRWKGVWPRVSLVLAAAAVLIGGLALAACGGGSPSSSGTAPTGSSGSSRMSLALEYSQCMRSHGVTDYPEPSASGGGSSTNLGGIDVNSPTYQSAQQACKKYSQGNTTPAQQAQTGAKMLSYAQCMRSHGVPNFPDPTTGPNGAPIFQLGGRAGVDTNSPTYQTANSSCQNLLGGGGAG